MAQRYLSHQYVEFLVATSKEFILHFLAHFYWILSGWQLALTLACEPLGTNGPYGI